MEACKKLLKEFSEGKVRDRTCRIWFDKFEVGDPSHNSRSSCPCLTTSRIAKQLSSSQQTICDHIRKLGLVRKYSKWVLNELSEKNMNDRVITLTSCTVQN